MKYISYTYSNYLYFRIFNYFIQCTIHLLAYLTVLVNALTCALAFSQSTSHFNSRNKSHKKYIKQQ